MNFAFETFDSELPPRHDSSTMQEKERLSSFEIHNTSGEKMCDVETISKPYGEDGVEQITQLILVAPSGERIDFLTYLNITDRHILVSPRYHGEHSWFSDSEIRLSPLKDAIDIVILIHESNHARQVKDDQVLEMARAHVKMSNRTSDQLFPLSPSYIALLRDVHSILNVEGISNDTLLILGNIADQFMSLREVIHTPSYEMVELSGIKLAAESALRRVFSESLYGSSDQSFLEHGILLEIDGLERFPNDNMLTTRLFPVKEEEGRVMLNASLSRLSEQFAFSVAHVEQTGDMCTFTLYILGDSRDTFLRVRFSVPFAFLDQRIDEEMKEFLLQYRRRSSECRELEDVIRRANTLVEEYAVVAAPYEDALLRMIKAPVHYLESDATKGAIHQLRDLRDRFGIDFTKPVEPTPEMQKTMSETIDGMRLGDVRAQEWRDRIGQTVNCVDYSLVALGTYGIDVASIEELERFPVTRRLAL